jgi:tRNA uridine 5-carboxymethylaminomethyl modification enzyme
VDKFTRLENNIIPQNINYLDIKSISTEAREKLHKIQPRSLGQASRISGVSPADLSVLLIYLEKYKQKDVPRETN